VLLGTLALGVVLTLLAVKGQLPGVFGNVSTYVNQVPTS